MSVKDITFICITVVMLLLLMYILINILAEDIKYFKHRLLFRAYRKHTKCRVIIKDIFSGDEIINVAGKLKITNKSLDLIEISDISNGVKEVHEVNLKDRSYNICVEKI